MFRFIIFIIFFVLSYCSEGNFRIRRVTEDWPQSRNQGGMYSGSRAGMQVPTTPGGGGYILRSTNRNLINKKKSKLYTPKTKEKKKPPIKFSTPDDFYSADGKSDEAIYLEDIVFKEAVLKNGHTIYNGEKLFFQNKLTDQFFLEDDKDLMTPMGICRANSSELKEDLADDGLANGSVKDTVCEKTLGRRKFLKGEIQLEQVSYNALEDWPGDVFSEFWVAMDSSCSLYIKKDGTIKSPFLKIASYAEMRRLCAIGKFYHEQGYDKIFLERYFSPFLIYHKNKNPRDGLFTGYYLWEISASRFPSSKYWYPIYRNPKNDELMKYSRRDINQGALRGKNLEILWCDSVYDAYSMQVQGSGIAYLSDGTATRLGYDGKNNFTFKSYSEKVKQESEFFANYCKAYSNVMDCLKKNSQIALYATNHNDSFVFFKELDGEEAFGSQGVPLTASRSIAIDKAYIPEGAIIYIETQAPLLEGSNWMDFNRLYVAQDTGSAIKGVARADLYMGHGFKAEYIAKNMKFKGAMYILLPNFAIDRIAQEQ